MNIHKSMCVRAAVVRREVLYSGSTMYIDLSRGAGACARPPSGVGLGMTREFRPRESPRLEEDGAS